MSPNNIKSPGQQGEHQESIVQPDNDNDTINSNISELLQGTSTPPPSPPPITDSMYTDADDHDNFSTNSFILERLTKESEKVLDNIKNNIKVIKKFTENGKNFKKMGIEVKKKIDNIINFSEKILSKLSFLKVINEDNVKKIKLLDEKLKKLHTHLKGEKKEKEDTINIQVIATLHREIHELYKKFNEDNHNDLDRIKNDKLKMNINHEKDFNKHLQEKLDFLSDRLDLLQMKYNGYKKWYDRINISIIIISTILSVFESFRLEVKDFIDESDHGLNLMFNMTPIIISSTITCSAAVVKFKKYQEKMEEMQFTREKILTSISRIENVKESLWFNKDHEFDNIKNNYLKEVFTTYNESISELKRHIKFDDPHKFNKHLNEKNKKKNKNKNIYI